MDPKQTAQQRGRQGQNGRRPRKFGKNNDQAKSGLERKLVSIRRVTRSYKGGKRLRMSVLVVVGDRAGRVGVAIAKGADVKAAEEKAAKIAEKNMIKINIKGNTISHLVYHKKGAAKILLRPAAPGTGIIAGSAIRAVAELAGIKDILSKVIGTNNKITNVYATMEALSSLIVRPK